MLHSCYWDHVSCFPIVLVNQHSRPMIISSSILKKSHDFQSNEKFIRSIIAKNSIHRYLLDSIPENKCQMKADNEMSDSKYLSYCPSDTLKILPN